MRLQNALKSQLTFHLIAAAALMGFVTACGSFTRFSTHAVSSPSEKSLRQFERLRSGPSTHEVMKAMGDDPENVIDYGP